MAVSVKVAVLVNVAVCVTVLVIVGVLVTVGVGVTCARFLSEPTTRPLKRFLPLADP